MTWNVSMGLDSAGSLQQRLQRQDDQALQNLALLVQTLRPDLLLLNEFDYSEGVDAAGLLNRNYLEQPQADSRSLSLPWSYSAPVNTGVDSSLDLDMNGKLHGPADGWGFGHFPGQYGMLVLSRLPIMQADVRSFRDFRWADMPDAQRPVLPDGTDFYPDTTWQALRLSSKSHWDIPVRLPNEQVLHFLVSHPTPPAFDGEEDRNGRRNHDEIRLWADYIAPGRGGYLVDDQGQTGGLAENALFVIAGDLNSDPVDGGSLEGAVRQLLEHPAVQAGCTPASEGGVAASTAQGGVNLDHAGNPAEDTADFSDTYVGNLRADYLLPSQGLEVVSCGVFWPSADEPLAGIISDSDHRAVWLDILVPAAGTPGE
jgi:endonuclease/exonuclease/phosphatase family metal-dependent hydrolase